MKHNFLRCFFRCTAEQHIEALLRQLEVLVMANFANVLTAIDELDAHESDAEGRITAKIEALTAALSASPSDADTQAALDKLAAIKAKLDAVQAAPAV